jgi:osmotically-inducible protein OsmY
MSKMRRDGAKRLIIEAAELDEYQPTRASEQAFNDLALASRVYATLFASPGVQGSALEVRAEGGHVHIKGRVDRGLEEDELMNLVKNIPGVMNVTTDVYSVQPDAFFGP